MESLDLNIQNYDLEDILGLFKINGQLTEQELKRAYRMYLKTHPDKSGLDARVFRFFKQAYDVLSKIYYFRNKKTQQNTTYDTTESNLSQDKLKILNKLNGLSCKEFNEKFNKMFELSKVVDGETDTGYEDWYRNYKDRNDPKINLSQFGTEFEKRKRESKALVKKQELCEMGGRGGYEIDRTGGIEYSSDIFSKLQYEDLKKAHTETVVPVTREDFENKERFNTFNSFKTHREQQDISPLSLQQSKNYLQQREQSSEDVNTRRIYNIIKRDEEVNIANEKMWLSQRAYRAFRTKRRKKSSKK